MTSPKLILIIFCFLFCSCDSDPMITASANQNLESAGEVDPNAPSAVAPFKCDGISFTSPPNQFPSSDFNFITDMETDWISVIPYGFSPVGSPNVTFDSQWQWWGEKSEGATTLCEYAQEHDLKIMVKPHIWISGDWIGNYELQTEEEYLQWEENYTAYILNFAQIAEEQGAEIFCVGTEYKKIAVQRPEYWRGLIAEVRNIFSGKLTYAANWDNYRFITFWDDLDFIGIDAYFPLVEAKTPSVPNLKEAWMPIKNDLKAFCQEQNRSITFTEFGYMSLDYTAWHNWENESNKGSLPVNMLAQYNSYQAFFETLWDEEWFGGGFLWKWYHDHPTAGGTNDKDYTPQNKPAAEIIQTYYERQ